MNYKKLLCLLPLVFLMMGQCRPPAGHNYKTGSLFSGPKTSKSLSGNTTQVTAQNTVRVKLFQGGREKIQTEHYTLSGVAMKHGSGTVLAEPGLLTPEKNIFKFRGKVYSGKLFMEQSGGSLVYVNHVSMDDYLVSVLSYEMNPSWPLEALKAQAVVSRTYLAHRMHENRKKPFDVDATTNHQVYGGLKKSEGNARRAVTETGNSLVLFKSEPAQVFFHSSCGGFLAASNEVWNSKPFAYLSTKKTSYCGSAPVFHWKAEMDAVNLSKKLGIPGIKKMRVTARNSSRRVKDITISSAGKTVKISGEDFRRKAGPTLVKSTMFGIRQLGNKIQLSGRGFGHGVGMCQWGAKFQAEKDRKNYKQIIEYYFPGTTVQSKSSFYLAKK